MPATEKISVTIGKAELGQAKRLANHLGLSLSGFITDAVRERIQEQARREAALKVLATFAPEERASPAEAQALLERWASSGAKRSQETRSRKASLKRRRQSR